ncbi:hypothetical protein RI578_22805 [Streptomyces sp. BB1-1-1]|uniref:hypothetical protein n=1 Tax=Streptomyces sp. BB1-1-1 TaxID=3074430 RepID=UPI00287784DD|nr:hypothetical protein [Streptomyces sp. BB1-1-1]WND36941.1 hypothetical protein RI578_22805 [Streptomyces sp. BB1-1-1]
MSTTRRAPKRKRDRRRAETEQLRTARRDTLSILLSRAQRGVLSRDEGALLRTHVEAELADGDTARASERGQQRAMERHRQRVEAAEATIAELERDLAEQRPKLSDSETLGHRLLQRAERAEGELAAVRNQLHDVKARRDDARAGRQDAERALARVRQADTLGAALAAVAQYDGLTPQAAAAQAAITDRADTLDARLAEQAREHAVELATVKRFAADLEQRARKAENTLDAIRRVRTWGGVWAQLGMFYRLRPEECGQEARARRTDDERAARDRAERAEQQLAAARSAADGQAATIRHHLERVRDLEARLAAVARYVDAAYEADVCKGVRDDVRRLLAGKQPTYGAPWHATEPDETAPGIVTEACARVDEHDAHHWRTGEQVKHCAGRYMPGHPYAPSTARSATR